MVSSAVNAKTSFKIVDKDITHAKIHTGNVILIAVRIVIKTIKKLRKL